MLLGISGLTHPFATRDSSDDVGIHCLKGRRLALGLTCPTSVDECLRDVSILARCTVAEGQGRTIAGTCCPLLNREGGCRNRRDEKRAYFEPHVGCLVFGVESR